MDYIKITHENLDKEHICCAISNNKDIQIAGKKAWLSNSLNDRRFGIFEICRTRKMFYRIHSRRKRLCPIKADGYMHINCFQVSGSFKGHGYANDLLSACIKDAKAQGKQGITIISSPKKMPFLSDTRHLAYKGFKLADKAELFYFIVFTV